MGHAGIHIDEIVCRIQTRMPARASVIWMRKPERKPMPRKTSVATAEPIKQVVTGMARRFVRRK
jgi:hypothetical protein